MEKNCRLRDGLGVFWGEKVQRTWMNGGDFEINFGNFGGNILWNEIKLILVDRKMFALSFDIKFESIGIKKSIILIEKRSVVTNNMDFSGNFFEKILYKNSKDFFRFIYQSIQQIETNRLMEISNIV
jgi:hypothetical protein